MLCFYSTCQINWFSCLSGLCLSLFIGSVKHTVLAIPRPTYGTKCCCFYGGIKTVCILHFTPGCGFYPFSAVLDSFTLRIQEELEASIETLDCSAAAPKNVDYPFL